MKVKVQCACGTRFEFEVEPVHGRMPMPINCPTCGVEATELANAVIRQQSAPSQPAVIASVAPTPPPPPPPASPPPAIAAPQSGLRISRSAHAPAVTAAAAAPSQTPQPAAASTPVEEGTPHCPKHQSEPAVEICKVCSKPMCLKCMEQFGYVCSVYCRQQATAKRIYIPPYANQKSVVAGKANAMGKYVTYSVLALIFLLFGFWIWYTWFARAPKIVYSLPIPKHVSESKQAMEKADDFYQLIGPNLLLSIKSKQMALMEVTEQKQLWSVAVQTDAETKAVAAARAKNDSIYKLTPKTYDRDGFETTRYLGLDPLGFEGDFLYASPTVIATTNDLWLAARNRLARFDRQTGSRKDTAVPGQIKSINTEENAILVVSDDTDGNKKLTEISLPDGGVRSEVIGTVPLPKTNAVPKLKTPVAPAPAAPAQVAQNTGSRKGRRGAGVRVEPTDKIPVDKVKAAASRATSQAAADPDQAAGSEEDSSYMFEDRFHPYVAAGPNVVQMDSKMLEHKTISHDVVRAPKKKTSLVDSGNLTAGQSMDAAQEMLNDMRRGQSDSKVEEDVSTYQVTLHRLFANGIPDWSGEVTGAPQFIPCKTVDVVAAGKSIQVFDKNNKKLWEGKLTYTVAEHYGRERSSCLETKDALYVADQGILTRFELSNGNVSWRLNSVGISKLQEDPKGNILVNTTTAGPETLSYSEQVNIHNNTHALILDVAAKSGKVIWRQESLGDTCMFSGKFLYATKVSSAFAALRLEQGPETVFVLRLLNPSTGNEIWQRKIGNSGVPKTEVQKNWIMLQFDDEVQVLKFFSL